MVIVFCHPILLNQHSAGEHMFFESLLRVIIAQKGLNSIWLRDTAFQTYLQSDFTSGNTPEMAGARSIIEYNIGELR